MYVDSGKWNDTVISRRKDRLRPKSLEVWWKRQINPADKLIGLRYPAMKEAMVTHTRVKKTRKAKEECKGSHPFLSEKTLPIVPFLFLLLLPLFTRFEGNLRRNGEETVPTAGRIKLDSRLDFRQEVVELVYKVPRPRPYYIYCVCSSRCLPGWLLHP